MTMSNTYNNRVTGSKKLQSEARLLFVVRVDAKRYVSSYKHTINSSLSGKTLTLVLLRLSRQGREWLG